MAAQLLRLLLLICCAVAPLIAAASPTLDRIRDSGTITFAYRDHAAPFSYTDRDGRVRGYSTELCMAVAAAIQQTLKLPSLKIAWQPVDAATRLDAVQSGRADAECGTTTITLSRMKDVDFSLPIFVDGASVLVRSKSRIAKLADPLPCNQERLLHQIFSVASRETRQEDTVHGAAKPAIQLRKCRLISRFRQLDERAHVVDVGTERQRGCHREGHGVYWEDATLA